MTDPKRLLDEAFAAYEAKDEARAIRRLDELLAGASRFGRAWLLRGVLHPKAEFAPRVALMEQAIAVDPADPQAWYNLGVTLGEAGRLQGALDAYRRAVALDPFYADALNNGCELERRFENFETALDWADRQLDCVGPTWSAHLNRAVTLLHLGRLDEADTAFEAACALAPDRPIVRWERFALRLFQQRFGEAWDDYEHRFACGHLNGVFCYPFEQPLWTGQSLAGKHILVHNEQGLGDQIMFAAALGEVVARAAQVTLVAAPTLVPLFAASFPGARVLPAAMGRFAGDHPAPSWLGQLGAVDYQAPIGSLMAVLRRTPESFADPRPYLRPSDAARAAWAGHDAGPGLKVGLCWASNPALFRHDSARRAVKKSMALEDMAPLARLAGVSLTSVLNWRIDPAPEAFRGRLTDLSARLTSMDQTAALIERLDLVVTVDTAVAHLAGAMGKETWLLLHDFPDARWGLGDARSYWYPDMTLIRQTSPGDWAGVIREVCARLAARTAP
jgi:tetratricopeptide (TPR) repeat protein